jgi:hypothetical protein
LKEKQFMKTLHKRNLSIAAVAFVLGLAAVFALARHRSHESGQVASYLLDERGAVNGLLLTNGDQLRFSPEMGEAITDKIKIGDTLTATGDAGAKSNYGREIRVKQISANGQTFTDAAKPPRPPAHPKEPKGAHPAPPPPNATQTPASSRETAPNAATSSDAAPPATADGIALSSPPQIIGATGTIKAHLVGARGEVNGLVLSGGEQVRFSPEVGALVIAAEKNGATQASVEGAGVRNERGTIIRPTKLTVGNQTIALGGR